MILLDTHIWIWYLNGSSDISPSTLKIINKAKSKEEIFISSMSVWETAMLIKNNRLQLKLSLTDWIEKSESLSFLNFITVDNRIAEDSVNLPGEFHKDPADRIIVATARHHNLQLITKDQRILDYEYVNSRW